MFRLVADVDAEAEFRRAIRAEQRTARHWAKRFVDACRLGDLDTLLRAADALNNETVGGWANAFRRLKEPAHPDIARVFLPIWVENKSIAADFESVLPLIKGLRYLLPAYTGGAVRLYRGEFARRWRRKAFGISWTSDLRTAERFATDMRQCSEGGSMIVETLAPADAIIAELDAHYDEHEFLVDRRWLGSVQIRVRFAQAEPVAHAAAIWSELADAKNGKGG